MALEGVKCYVSNNMINNTLIVSAGRRVSLVREFKQTASEFDKRIKVFTADMEPSLASACHVSDGCFQVKRARDNGYAEELMDICKANKIGIVIPTIDTCLPILAERRQFFEDNGIHIIVSAPTFVDICHDKRKTFKFFVEHGICHPKLVDISAPTFPLFAKPFDGSSSIGAQAIMCEDDLSESLKNNPKIMFMELIDRSEYREFTVDMYFGRDNHVKAIVPRERIEIRGGEVSKSATRKNYLVGFLKERFEYLPGTVGSICIQLFYRESDNDVVGIEINPRFGGGYPLTFHAGANFPRMILEEYLQGKQLEYNDNWRDNLLMLRYDAEVIVNPSQS